MRHDAAIMTCGQRIGLIPRSGRKTAKGLNDGKHLRHMVKAIMRSECGLYGGFTVIKLACRIFKGYYTSAMKAFLLIARFLVKAFLFTLLIQFQVCCEAQPTSWTKVFANSPVTIASIAYGNGTFVGFGSGLWFVSHDGANWSVYETPPIIDQGAVAYGNGVFMAFGTNHQYKVNYILESTNGISWYNIYTSSNTLSSAAFGNNTWVFVANNEIINGTTTPTGWRWSDYQPVFNPVSICYGGGNFVVNAHVS